MGFFKKPVAQIDNDEKIRREIRARVAKQVGIYDEEYINTGKIGGAKNTDAPIDDTAKPTPEAEVLDAETLVEAETVPEADVPDATVSDPDAVDVVVLESETLDMAAKVSDEITIEPKEKPPTKKNESKTETKPNKEKTLQNKKKTLKEEKPVIKQNPPKEEKPQTKKESPKENITPKKKKPPKKKKTNIALILFIIILILAFIPLYYFLTGGNVEGPRLKVNSSDMKLFLNEPLLVRGLVSDSDNPDGMKVYYSLDNGSASLLYTFKEGPGPFEYEIELPDTVDYLGDHSVTLYAENPTGEISKAIVLNYEVVKPGLVGLEIKTQPTKVIYLEGEPLDLTGLVVSATYEDGNTALITDYTSDLAAGTKLWRIGEKPITISYIEEDITKTATINVSVQKGPVEMPPKKMNGIYTVPAMNE